MSGDAWRWVAAYSYVFICSFGVSWLVTPQAMKLSRRFGFLDDPGGRKIHSTPTPLLGGAAVLVSFAAVVLIHGLLVMWLAPRYEWLEPFAHGFGHRQLELVGVLGGGAMMLALGLADDWRDLSAKVKLAGQILVAVIIVAAGVRLKLFLANPWLSGAVTVFWIVSVTNAMNFFDNMDGMCAGIGFLAALCFAVVAGLHHQFLVGGLALAFAGALLGFLIFNFSPAKIFLGDAGSHLVGVTLAVLAILPTFYQSGGPSSKLTVFIPLVVLALPLFDAGAVVVIRWREGRPIYKGDKRHLTHRLEAKGFSRRGVAGILYGVQVAMGMGAMGLLWLPWRAGVVVIAGCLILLVGVNCLPQRVKE